MSTFTFDHNGYPVECNDQFGDWTNFVLGVWARDDCKFHDAVGRFDVSTYFVGLDLRGRLPWGPEPLIWETWVYEMTADKPWPQVDYLGHATRGAAAAAHRELISQIKRGIYKPTGRRWDPDFEKGTLAPNAAG